LKSGKRRLVCSSIIECRLSIHEVLDFIPRVEKKKWVKGAEWIVYTCNPRTGERLRQEDWEFKASLGYIVNFTV
jgi:hypothetical protein